MLTTLVFLGFSLASHAIVQEPESPRLVIETRALPGNTAVGNCEVILFVWTDLPEAEQRSLFSGRLDLHAMLQERGSRHTSGVDGRLEIPLPSGEFMIGARSQDGRVAYEGSVDPEDETLVVLWLLEERPLRFRCRDETGSLLQGIPVAVVPEFPMPLSLQTAWTDEHGVAQLNGLMLPATFGSLIGMQFAIDLPLESEILIAHDDERLAQDPVELVIPPLGSVRVVLPNPWRTRETNAPWMWLSAGTEKRGAWCRLEEGATEAVFPQVGLGLTLQVQVGEFGEDAERSSSFAGPTKAGEVIEFLLEYPAPPTAERFLLALGPDGVPLASQTFEMLRQVRAPRHSYMTPYRLRSDAEGRIPLPAFEKDAEEEDQYLHVVREEFEGGPRLQAEAQPTELFDAGAGGIAELRFRECRVLVAGRVVDERGHPLAGAELNLSSKHLGGRVHVESVRSAEDGSFRFLGVDDRTRFVIWVERPGYERQEVENVANGAEDVEIVCRHAERISGRVVFDAGIALQDFRVILESPRSNYHELLDYNGRFRVQRNGPGAFTSLRVESHEGVEPFLFWSGEELQRALTQGAAGEITLDLRGKVRAIPYRFQFSEPQTETNWVGARRIGRNGPEHALLSDGRGVLYVKELPVDLRFLAQGFRSVELRGVTDAVAIEFVAGPRLTVRLDHPEWIPDGWEVKLWAPDRAADRTVTRRLDRTGVVTIPFSDPGTTELTLRLDHGERSRYHMLEERELQIHEGANEVVIELVQKQLREMTEL